jgi:hypothetical protein
MNSKILAMTYCKHVAGFSLDDLTHTLAALLATKSKNSTFPIHRPTEISKLHPLVDRCVITLHSSLYEPKVFCHTDQRRLTPSQTVFNSASHFQIFPVSQRETTFSFCEREILYHNCIATAEA